MADLTPVVIVISWSWDETPHTAFVRGTSVAGNFDFHAKGSEMMVQRGGIFLPQHAEALLGTQSFGQFAPLLLHRPVIYSKLSGWSG